MLAVAFLPHPPLLKPELAPGLEAEAGPLRAACAAAVEDVLAAGPDRVVLLGGGARSIRHRPDARGTLAGFGTGAAGTPDGPPAGTRGPALPLSLTLGRLLLDRAGWDGPVLIQELEPDAGAERDVAQALVREAGGAAGWLVLADGAARPEGGWGRQPPDEARVAVALAAGDPVALAGAARPAWRVAAAAAGERRPVSARLDLDAAPFGTGYLVARWRFDG